MNESNDDKVGSRKAGSITAASRIQIEEKKVDDEDAALDNAFVNSGNIIAPSSSLDPNPRAPPLQKPSYYIDSFHEHFFPHPENDEVEEGADGVPTRRNKKLSLFQRYATSMARKPWTHLSIAFVIAVVLSFVGLRFGEFKVAIDNAGWWSRGTLIANRATQEIIVATNTKELFYDESGEVWEELTTVVQPNWQSDAVGEEDESEGGGNSTKSATEVASNETLAKVCSGQWYGSRDMVSGSQNNLVGIWKTDDADSKKPERNMLDVDAMYDLCLAEEETLSALQSDDSCYKCPVGEAEEEKCIEPFSLVLLARLYLTGNDDMSQLSTLSESISCDSLKSAWNPTIQKQFTTALKTCVNWSVRMSSGDASNNITIQGTTITVSNPCPFPLKFLPTVVDDLFPTSDPPLVRYSSSYFATKKNKADIEVMYEASENGALGRSDGDPLEGVYDTTDQSFYDYYSDAIVGRDMALAVGSAGVTVIAMMLHTKSPFLTLMGLFQIILSFPLAYFVYYFIAGLVFFPFLNFIGIFVVFALGADDVFVAVDKWKNARHELPHGTTEQVAALALPDAAYAMLLTSTTTAVAFFGTAICPVGPIVCFAVFCGLLITFDYMMNILLVFPALCIYDRWLLAGSRNCCVNFDWSCRRKEGEDEAITEQDTKVHPGVAETGSTKNGSVIDVEETMPVENSAGHDIGDSVKTFARDGDEEVSERDPDPNAAEREELIKVEHKSFIHRIFDGYYNFLHKFRWPILVIVLAGTITCIVFAAQLSLPTSSEVALLPDGNQYQKHSAWAQNLLSSQIVKEEGTEAVVLFGVKPADTGDHLNPDSWTTLVLDEKFDAKSEDSQLYLRDFCDRMFAEFGKVEEDYECPMNKFDQWLKEQSALETPTDAYSQSCNGESAVPVSSNVFHPCMISWSKHTETTAVLSTGGSVKIMQIRAKSDVAYDAPFNKLKDEWTSYETWFEDERSVAPSGVNQMYHSDLSFWWFDTNQQMMKTAYGAAGIALVCAAVIIFISSKSFTLTFFAAISIVYVLVAATACLVGLGWELGFLESILFAILIGISCDFVIHFGHAYTMYTGNVNRHYRSHFSLTHMGPSILAAAFTTFMAAVVMVFTEITFFRKFAVMLFMTIVHSTIGCFIVFLVLCDCFGPAEPTKGYYTIKEKLCGKKK